MDVYLVPIASDRFESYYEASDDDEPAQPTDDLGFFGRLNARFQAQLREAERARHQVAPEEPHTFLGRMQRRSLRWIAERIAEQRLLWHLRKADAATLHVAADLDPQAGETIMRTAMKRDADRHLKLLALHSVALVASAPVAFIPGPNVLGYLFTFTVVGHFLAWRGARRGLTSVRWHVSPNAALTELRAAFVLGTEARHRVIHDVAHRLHLPKLARFVEHMAATSA
ncbi:MAG: hypothetical protein AB7N29_12275 [Vicinamibacterales bacterium]